MKQLQEQCRLCGNSLEYVFSHPVLGKYNVKYFVCGNCALLQTEKPYWLDEAYSSATSAADTGIFSRNINISKTASVFMYFLFFRAGKFIDYGGGHGIFTRLMRDVGFDFYSFDKYAENLFARGFEAKKLPVYDGATAIEVFEHFDDPLKTMEEMFNYLKNKNILFTTELYGNHIPHPDHWRYYVFNTGQHVSFYNVKTLYWMAKQFNLHLWTDGRSLHCFTEKRFPRWKLKLLKRFNKILFYYVNRCLPSRTIPDSKINLSYNKLSPVSEAITEERETG